MSLAQVVENDGTLVVTQSNDAALRDLRTVLLRTLSWVGTAVFSYLLFPQACKSWLSDWSVGPNTPPPAGMFFFLNLPMLWLLLRSINRLFGKEVFIFDGNTGVFVRNGYTVGPLREIRNVTAQVTRGEGQNPMFRLVLELPRCQTVPIITTHYLRGNGDLSLSRNGFSDPNKKFAVFEPWLDCNEQDLIPFIPPEIVELRQKILSYLAN